MGDGRDAGYGSNPSVHSADTYWERPEQDCVHLKMKLITVIMNFYQAIDSKRRGPNELIPLRKVDFKKRHFCISTAST